MSRSAATKDAIYQFGDSELAAERLGLLAEVFAPSSAEFLAGLGGRSPVRILDAGCGCGHTTRLLAEVFPTALVAGVDTSAAFIQRAASSPHERIQFLEADVSGDLPGGPYDLVYARYLLTHLPRAFELVQSWAKALAPNGRIALEENEWIETDEAVFSKYLAIVERMLAMAGKDLYIGRRLAEHRDWDGLTVADSEVCRVAVDSARTAQIFLMNFRTWRHQEYVREHHRASELDALARELGRVATLPPRPQAILFGHRRLVLAREDAKLD
ncbi:MAG TPA: class I SAM-dependent methyltransferase [Pirellulales bacterium]|nr:class I SAM-dependent methyltransferase [Pirellulales bacterium]